MEKSEEDFEGFIAPGLEEFESVNVEIPSNIVSKLVFIKDSGIIREDITLSGTICYLLLDVINDYYYKAKKLEKLGDENAKEN